MSNLAQRPPLGQKQGNATSTASGKEYMAQVAKLKCVICGAWPVHVHHCISARFESRRASDFATIPLCPACHQGPHGIHASKAAWEALHGPDTGFIAGVRSMVARDGQ